LAIIDAMAPCIVMLDEVEKAFGGATQGSAGDSGVGSRMFGSFLSWLNDHTSDVFVVCTANDVSRLPPEFGRAERFDGVFFVDLPNADEKTRIWDLYLREYELDQTQPLPDTHQWTGAEIKACCRLTALLEMSLVEAAQQIVPVAVTNAESIERLRNWARGRCLDASSPGLFGRTEVSPKQRRRATGIGPSPSRN
jgi:SpoVK/Ycf46/Vps4 family AAA+-type ATPase